jgi:hypothetical protein
MTRETDTAVTLPVLGHLTYREIHSFQHGLYCGTLEGVTDDIERTPYHDGSESHYWRMGYLCGYRFLRE